MKSTTGLDLKNISAGGQPPESRLNDAAEVQDMVDRVRYPRESLENADS